MNIIKTGSIHSNELINYWFNEKPFVFEIFIFLSLFREVFTRAQPHCVRYRYKNVSDEIYDKSFQVSISIEGLTEEHKPVTIVDSQHSKNRQVLLSLIENEGIYKFCFSEPGT